MLILIHRDKREKIILYGQSSMTVLQITRLVLKKRQTENLKFPVIKRKKFCFASLLG